MMKRTCHSVSLCLAAIVLIGTAIAQAEKSKSTAAYEQLSALVGEWTGVQDGQQGIDIKLTYTLTADGSTLMEEFRSSKGTQGQVMMTMFSVDGDHLLATHYCVARNQPQMATGTITEPRNKVLAFSLVRVTGMTTPEDWHNTGLEVLLEDKDHFAQRWTWLYKGKTGTTTFHFTRKGA